jgi:hypothetical protein
MEKIKPERVVAMLHKKGVEIDVEQAVLVLSLLRRLSKMVVSNYLKMHQNKNERCKLDKEF